MEISLNLNQQKVSALGELLMVAAKAPTVSDEGMKLALLILDDLKAAVAAANKTAQSVAPVEGEILPPLAEAAE